MAEAFGIPARRWPIALAMLLLLAFTLSWLQGRFDSSDAKKAIAAAMAWKPAGGQTVIDDAHHHDDAPAGERHFHERSG